MVGDFRVLWGVLLLWLVFVLLWMKATFVGAWRIMSPFLSMFSLS